MFAALAEFERSLIWERTFAASPVFGKGLMHEGPVALYAVPGLRQLR
jgi:hypothetical protein